MLDIKLPPKPEPIGRVVNRYGTNNIYRLYAPNVKKGDSAYGDEELEAYATEAVQAALLAREDLVLDDRDSLRAEIVALKGTVDLHQHLAAALYQAAGAFNMPERFLDCLDAATRQEGYGEFSYEMVDKLLPVFTDEPGVWDEETEHE